MELCPACKKNARKINTADKKLETDDILASRYDDKFAAVGGNTTPAKPEPQTHHIDFLEQKRAADAVDKMCPMCAKIYSSSASFDDFQDHVESHFIDDSELDTSIDKNFEFVSHTLGNF